MTTTHEAPLKASQSAAHTARPASLQDVPVDVRNPAVFGALYRQYIRVLIAVAVKSAVPTAEAEEMAQTAFTKLFESPAVFLSEAAARAFLITSVRNLVIDRSRKIKTRKTDAVGVDADRLDRADDRWMAEHEQSVDAVSEMIDLIAVQKGNEAFGLFYKEGLSVREIAALTGEAVSSVTAKLCRLRAKYRNDIRAHVEARLA